MQLKIKFTKKLFLDDLYKYSNIVYNQLKKSLLLIYKKLLKVEVVEKLNVQKQWEKSNMREGTLLHEGSNSSF